MKVILSTCSLFLFINLQAQNNSQPPKSVTLDWLKNKINTYEVDGIEVNGCTSPRTKTNVSSDYVISSACYYTDDKTIEFETSLSLSDVTSFSIRRYNDGFDRIHLYTSKRLFEMTVTLNRVR